MPPESSTTRMPWDVIVLSMGVLSWVGCCVGSCLGMGYLGTIFALLALPLGFVGAKDPDTNQPMLYAGLALSVLHLLAYLLLIVVLLGSLLVLFLVSVLGQ